MPIDQIRNLLVIALCAVVFFMWQAWQRDYGPGAPPAPATPAGAGTPAKSPAASSATTTTTAPAAPAAPHGDVPLTPGSSAAAAPAPATKVEKGPRIDVTTDVYHLQIDPQGGGIVALGLRKYPVSTDKPKVPFELFTDTHASIFVEQSGLLSNEPAPNHHARYEAARLTYDMKPGQRVLEVPLTWHGPHGLTVVKTYRFQRNSYVVNVDFRVTNASGREWTGRMYGQLQRTAPPSKHHPFHTYTYTGGAISTSDKPYEKIDFSRMEKAPLAQDVKGGWVAMLQHYFLGAWIPSQKVSNHFYTKALPDNRFAIGLVTPAVSVAPASTGDLSLRLYAGPKVQERIQKVAPHLERTIDYGWLWFIAEPLFQALRWIHGFLGNWGFSIIVLTLCIKLVFFHLSATSYKSMARMRKLQPRIAALRERYAGDKQRMNQAMMELYKTEKINPLGGCLPIVVQIPVFISLYWMLLESVALRQAPFIFWIHDLSVRDPYYVLPVIMGLTMLVQQKLNPSPPDPIQAKVMMALPFVFTFFFLAFPAGLVIYWIVNNCLSIIQQWIITRKIIGTS